MPHVDRRRGVAVERERIDDKRLAPAPAAMRPRASLDEAPSRPSTGSQRERRPCGGRAPRARRGGRRRPTRPTPLRRSTCGIGGDGGTQRSSTARALRRQLARAGDVAERVRALLEEAPAAAPHVHAGARAVAVGRPGRHRHGPDVETARGGGSASAIISALSAAWRGAADVRQHVAAARQAGVGRDAVGRRLEHLDRRAPRPCAAARARRARVTRSPGIAPATSTTAPSWRAIMRPPTAGRSI